MKLLFLKIKILKEIMKNIFSIILFLLFCLILSDFAYSENVEKIISLNGVWDFKIDRELKFTINNIDFSINSRKINVPSCWEAEFEDLLNYSGVCWYRKTFKVPEGWEGKRVLIRFDAVDYFTELWVNKELVGNHEGGYLPFYFEIQEKIDFDKENEIIVKVADPYGKDDRFPEFPFREIPHGKQSWYSPSGGIWQNVSITAKNENYFTLFHITPDVDKKKAVVRVILKYPPVVPGKNIIKVDIYPEKLLDDKKYSSSINLMENKREYNLEVEIPDFTFWDIDNPFLYKAVLSLFDGEMEIDGMNDTFGMRKFEIRDKRIYLNGHALYLNGALDQDYYPLTRYRAPSDEFIKDQFLKGKYMGLNFLRTHIKIPEPGYVYQADRLGLLLWVDLPNWDILTDKAKERAKKTMKEWIERDYNHPSIFVWNIINESWGINLRDVDQRKWLSDMYDYVKSLDKTRFVVDNSVCGGNAHVKTDIEDTHYYYSIPEHKELFDKKTREFAHYADWNFFYEGYKRVGTEPLVQSEFGNWGLPSVNKLKKYYGGEPWWFKTGRRKSTIPEGAENRFYDWGLDQIYGSFDGLALASQKSEFEALKYQIENFRKYPNIVGHVITEFTDLNWESNGLLDMCRNTKAFYEDIGKVHNQDLIIPYWEKINFWSGEKFEMNVGLSHFSKLDIRKFYLRWRLVGFDIKGKFDNISVNKYTSTTIGKVEFVIPDVVTSQKTKILFELIDSSGGVVSENFQEIRIFPAEYKKAARKVNIYLDKSLSNLKDALINGGFQVWDNFNNKIECAVSSNITPELEDYLSQNGNLLLLKMKDIEIKDDLPVKFISRDVSGRWGDWCSSFIWLKKDKMFQRVHLDDNLGFSFYNVTPEDVILGYNPENNKDCFGGIFVGWLHVPAVLIGQFNYINGKVMVTTFNVIKDYQNDPVPTIMLNDMITYVSSDNFNPELNNKK